MFKKIRNDLQKTKITVPLSFQIAKVAQLVEHNLAKVRVAGSSPVFRSEESISGFGRVFLYQILFCAGGGIGRHATLRGWCEQSCVGSNPVPRTKKGCA